MREPSLRSGDTGYDESIAAALDEARHQERSIREQNEQIRRTLAVPFAPAVPSRLANMSRHEMLVESTASATLHAIDRTKLNEATRFRDRTLGWQTEQKKLGSTISKEDLALLELANRAVVLEQIGVRQEEQLLEAEDEAIQ